MMMPVLRGAIGYVPQEVLLFSGSVRENIAWGNGLASQEEIEQAAAAAQIHDTVLSLPQGYDTMLGQRGVNLSGGQKQRLTIARAMVRKPAILILDDSTSALDAVTEGLLLAELKKMSCTTFLITQKISSTVSADLILLLDDGRLIARGTHSGLMRESALYRKIYQSQTGEAQYVQSTH
jgi:ATP-binding cassette subfamily B protein